MCTGGCHRPLEGYYVNTRGLWSNICDSRLNKVDKVLDKWEKYYIILYEGYPSKNSNEDFVDGLHS